MAVQLSVDDTPQVRVYPVFYNLAVEILVFLALSVCCELYL